ncbi:MAG: hypothetical protein ACQGVK_02775 [Myxococcota bacterium]
MEESTRLSLQCLFCSAVEFVLPEEGYDPVSGDQLECANCGRTNDYDSMMRVVQRKGREWGEAQAKELIDDFTKDLKKLFK